MKKLVSFLLVAMLLSVLCVCAYADGAQLVVGDVEAPVAAGESFTMSVSVVNNPGIAAITLDLDYDHEALQLVSAEGKLGGESWPLTEGGSFGPWDIDDIADTDRVIWFNYENVTGDQEVMTLTFTVLEGAEGEYTVGLKGDDSWSGVFNESSSDPLAFSFVPGPWRV